VPRSLPLGESEAPPPWTRRRLLVVGATVTLLGPATLAGCSLSDPTIDAPAGRSGDATRAASPAAPGSPPPPAPVGYPDEASQEQALADLAAAVGARGGLSADQRRLLGFLWLAHADHARVLAGPDPATRVPAPPPAAHRPSLTGLDLKQALTRLSRAETAIAGRHRGAAVAATGRTALLWGSLAVAAETFAAAATRPGPVVAIGPHRPAELVSDVAALQALVAQLHAIVYGYQMAIGRLPVVSPARARAVTDLMAHRVQRDRLSAILARRSADVPVADPAYVPSVVPSDAATASSLIRRMETALMPFCGLWLGAAATTTDRELALASLGSTTRTAASWGAGVRAWPGWSD